MEKKQFTSFYDTHVERIYRFVLYRVGNRKEIAEDLTQDIFLRAFEALSQ